MYSLKCTADLWNTCKHSNNVLRGNIAKHKELSLDFKIICFSPNHISEDGAYCFAHVTLGPFQTWLPLAAWSSSQTLWFSLVNKRKLVTFIYLRSAPPPPPPTKCKRAVYSSLDLVHTKLRLISSTIRWYFTDVTLLAGWMGWSQNVEYWFFFSKTLPFLNRF